MVIFYVRVDAEEERDCIKIGDNTGPGHKPAVTPLGEPVSDEPGERKMNGRLNGGMLLGEADQVKHCGKCRGPRWIFKSS